MNKAVSFKKSDPVHSGMSLGLSDMLHLQQRAWPWRLIRVSNLLFIRKANPLIQAEWRGLVGRIQRPPESVGRKQSRASRKQTSQGSVYFSSPLVRERPGTRSSCLSFLLSCGRPTCSANCTSKYRHAWRHWGLKLQHMTWGGTQVSA